MAAAKTKAVQQTISDWNSIPKEVRDKADSYRQKQNDAGEARGAMNTARENLITAMKKHELPAVKLEDGKVLKLSAKDVVRIEKAQKPGGAANEADDDEDDDGDDE